MAFRSLLFVASVAVAVGACALVDPVDMRYDVIGRSLAKARDESIFLNLVRAAHDYPLSFDVISQVSPSMTNVSGLGLPSFLLGPQAAITTGTTKTNLPTTSPGRDIIFGSTTAADSTSVSSNFNVATQETAAFYQGFLRPIELQVLNYFIRQGYPRELLFWLFTDAFEVTVHGQKLGYKYDPPNDYGCDPHDPNRRCFIDWVHIATFAGLTVEEETVEKESAAKDRSSGGAGTAGGTSKSVRTVYTQFCDNRISSQRALAIVKDTHPDLYNKFVRGLPPLRLDVSFQELYDPTKACGALWPPPPPNKPQPDAFPLEFRRSGVTFTIIPRSAYGVFEFLGTLIKMQTEDLKPTASAEQQAPRGRPELFELPLLSTVPEDPKLITVLKSSDQRCFSHTWFYDGEYCVPERATTTKRIFSLLAQLIAIQTAASDLSITPLVRIIQ